MMPKELTLLLYLPALAGILSLVIKAGGLRRNFCLFTFFVGIVASLYFFFGAAQNYMIRLIGDYSISLALNKLSGLILIFVNLFGLLVCLYSKGYEEIRDNRFYFAYLSWLIAASNLICLSADFITFIFSWGITLILLYLLLNIGSSQSANKALSVVGLGDFSLMLGICLYIFATGSTFMPTSATLSLNNPIAWFSFILMLLGAFAKAGCGPLHTWIPTASESAPLPVMAILPASLDKLLGIYLLARISVDFFILNNIALAILLFIGSLTIIFAVLLALIQHDLRKLLSFHAISQVGYMVLGFGTGNPIGIAGALFHMVNHAIYKSGLFLTGGSVGQKKKTYELANLGGLAAYMPISFACALVFALSISGVPPFNGFASKWMIYQGTIIGLTNNTSKVMMGFYCFALISAMFGSALTLASFVKFIHAVFLGEEKSQDKGRISEVSSDMKISVIVLAGLCVLLGVLPFTFLNTFLRPWLNFGQIQFGSWNSLLAFIWIIAGLVLGFLFWSTQKKGKIRQDSMFIGGEEPVFNPNFPATEFYRTVEELPLMTKIYRVIKLEAFDIYNLTSASLRLCAYLLFIFIDRTVNLLVESFAYLVLGISWIFRKLHSGVLDLYLSWSLIGLIILLFILMSH